MHIESGIERKQKRIEDTQKTRKKTNNSQFGIETVRDCFEEGSSGYLGHEECRRYTKNMRV